MIPKDQLNFYKNCYNKYCGAKIKQPRFGPNAIMELCPLCWSKFDDQKMRGRFRMEGISDEEQPVLMEGLIKAGYEVKEWDLRRQINELRYTESIDEWIEWQRP